jgi:hypothetical protein
MAERTNDFIADPGRHRTIWRKSTVSGSNSPTCVEVSYTLGVSLVRDSKSRAGPRLVFSRRAWHRFLTEVSGRTGKCILA